jgi:hypothetical protein
VSGQNSNSETQIDDLNERLSAGLETCRSVVANYKSLLAGDAVAVEQDADGRETRGSPVAE